VLGKFDELSLEDIRWLMEINFWGVIYGVFYFMPLLKKERRAHIVNTSSCIWAGGSGSGRRLTARASSR